MSLTTGIPIPLLFGEAPSGLSTDEKSWWANWASTVSQHQEDRYRAPLEWLCRMLYAAQGGEPEEWSLEFNALGELSEKEKAEIRKLLTEADTIAIKDRVVSADRVRRSRYGADGWSMDIQPPTPEEEALEAEPPPEPPAPGGPGNFSRGEGSAAEEGGQGGSAAASEPAADPQEDTPPTADRADVAEDSVVLALEVPEGVGWSEAQAAVAGLLPGLQIEDWPHVTLLYLGPVPTERMEALQEAVGAVLEEAREELLRDASLFPHRLGHFGDGQPGAGGVPIVVHYHAWALELLQLALLRALAPFVAVAQHP